MTNYTTGWIIDKTDDRDYFLETVIRQLPPQEIETEGKNIRLERAIFAKDDDSPVLKRALRLVSEEEWKAEKSVYDEQNIYFLLPLVKNNKDEASSDLLRTKNLFFPDYIVS